MRSKWQCLKSIDRKTMNETEQMIHHAAQFVGMVTHSYTPRKDDDSHSNMEWLEEKGLLCSHSFNNGVNYIALNISDFNLEIRNIGHTLLSDISLSNKTREDVFNWLKTEMQQLGLNPDKLRYFDHFELDSDPLGNDNLFLKPDPVYLGEWRKQRTNANLILSKLNQMAGEDSKIVIWPHHFDSAVYYSLEKDENEMEMTSIVAGWAISDNMVGEGYFYIYGWNRDHNINYTSAPELEFGNWSNDSWKGAYLKISDIINIKNAENEERACLNFYNETLKYIRTQLKSR